MEIAPSIFNHPTIARPIINVSTTRLLSNTLVLGLTLTLCGATASVAATATTDPVGYNTISLLANSDTYVSVPFHRPAAFVGQVSSFSGNVITVAGTPGWTASQFVYASGTQANTYYAFIRSGTKEGNYYTVTANAGNTLTIDLAGDTLTGLAANDSISIIPYWTLGTLFPAADAGVSFTTSASPFAVQTYVLIPNLQASGINLSTTSSYFFYNGAWRLFGQDLTVSRNDDTLIPDTYFIVRNNASAGTLTQTGSVLTKKFVTPLQTYTGGKQDNPVALLRPVPVTLDDSGLAASGAFSASSSPLNLSDILLVFDNTVAAKNKSSSATYYYYNGAWRKFGADASQNFGSTVVFGPGTGVQIRKATSSTGSASIWTNSATY
ncbi:TIGR02597 family protein [Nibricoccus aquaticus]|uniref:TIGR02597 family protein n=1 Tax=Nibricoccus aquaticus TaxID=2576891 RepID=UPI001586C83E|nr:TIGR02597 family protein [Nibricoccus aquaticus]